MKKLSLHVLTLLFVFGIYENLKAQTIYFEDFTSGMPTDITLIDADGLTINENLVPPIPAQASWVVLPDEEVASSASWFTPEGCCAEDWMILPPISIGEFVGLRWRARAVDSAFPDGYEVRYSLIGPDTAAFNANPPLFKIPEETGSWSEREIFLHQSGIQDTTIHLAFINNSNDMFILQIDEIEVFNIAEIDMAVVGLEAPVNKCTNTSAEEVTIEIKNVGIQDATDFEVYYSINGGTIVTETFVGTLEFNESATYTFSQTADLSTPGDYEFTIGVNLPNDEVPDNNEITGIEVSTFSALDLAANDFNMSFEENEDFSEWTIVDANESGTTWRITAFDANTGDFSAGYFWNESFPADDWLITPCFDLEEESYYILEFYYAIGGAQFPEQLKVHLGSDNNPDAMDVELVDFGMIFNEEFEQSTQIFSPSSSGIFHVGFHAYSDADQWAILIDDVSLRKLKKPQTDFTYEAVGLTVDFTDLSENLPTQWDWDFGDPGVPSASNSQNPSYTYSEDGTYNVCLVASNQAGAGDAVCKQVEVVLSNVSELQTFTKYNVYPNPVKHVLHISLELKQSETIELGLYNQLGQRVAEIFSGNSSGLQKSISTAHLSSGVYFLKLKNNERVDVRKILVAE